MAGARESVGQTALAGRRRDLRQPCALPRGGACTNPLRMQTPDEKSGLQQLKMYLGREPHARTGIWFNGIDYTIVYKTSLVSRICG